MADHDVERHGSPGRQEKNNLNFENTEPYDCCSYFLIIISYLLVIVTFPFTFFMYFRIVQQYERAVIFRLGRLKSGGAKGPGLFFIIPCIDEYRKIDLRVVSFQVPPQEILSKDSVTVEVDAVVYFRIFDPTISVVNVENAISSTKLLAQTTLRNVLGTKNLSEMLSHREEISGEMQNVLDTATAPWGVKVQRVEVKDIRLPKQLQRAMAAEAEAAREAKAKVISADGERQASEALRSAAFVLGEHPAALQLRYLQTLNTISAEHNSTIIFPLPMDVLTSFLPKFQQPSNPPAHNIMPTYLQQQHPQDSSHGEKKEFKIRSIHSSAGSDHHEKF
ncbi:hypothetical protein M3Y97_00522400 [Aphelenchoides bicaudatus]|nr:hypothetical protein M3Y97_00522400 [Aphelenchoides bicaudatus]